MTAEQRSLVHPSTFMIVRHNSTLTPAFERQVDYCYPTHLCWLRSLSSLPRPSKYGKCCPSNPWLSYRHYSWKRMKIYHLRGRQVFAAPLPYPYSILGKSYHYWPWWSYCLMGWIEFSISHFRDPRKVQCKRLWIHYRPWRGHQRKLSRVCFLCYWRSHPTPHHCALWMSLCIVLRRRPIACTSYLWNQ